jgi:hypothetical protein
MLIYGLAATAIVALLALFVALRTHDAWTQHEGLTELVRSCATKQLGDRLGKPIDSAVLRVLRVNGDHAVYAIQAFAADSQVTARAGVERRSDGSLAIRTELLSTESLAA